MLRFNAPVDFISEPQNRLTNRLSLSGRVGFNISVRFGGMVSLPAPQLHRTTPRGNSYNYDNGYVLTDVSGEPTLEQIR